LHLKDQIAEARVEVGIESRTGPLPGGFVALRQLPCGQVMEWWKSFHALTLPSSMLVTFPTSASGLMAKYLAAAAAVTMSR
jgi:hypothetical protein